MESEPTEGESEPDTQSPQSDQPSNRSRRSLLRRGATAVGALVLGTAAASEPASAQRSIDRCTVISESGTHVLTQDIEHDDSAACIRIEANDVVLDGEGHTITSQRDSSPGIFISNFPQDLRNVTVRDIGVTGFRHGIVAQRLRDSSIRHSRFLENSNNGIFINAPTIGPGNVEIRNNTATGNHTGIATRGRGIDIENNRAIDNELRGIYVRANSNSATVSGNTVRGHRGPGYPGVAGNPGIEVDSIIGSSHTVGGNFVDGNSIGILLKGGTENTVGPFNFLQYNGTYGIRLQESVTETTIQQNDFRSGAVGNGISLSRSHANLIQNNRSAPRTHLTESDENMVRENRRGGDVHIANSETNTLFDNDITQARIDNATGTLVLGNRISTGTGQVVQVKESQDTLIQGNEISGAGTLIGIPGTGVFVTDSVRTNVWFNGIRDNDIGVQIGVNGAETTTIANNNLVSNREYGIKNNLEQVADGRFNYWGASNGPSSPSDPDAPFADPVTGRLANGDGDAVSESPKSTDAGVSNVRFHPWSRSVNPLLRVRLPRIRPLPIEPPSPIKPPFLPPLELCESASW